MEIRFYVADVRRAMLATPKFLDKGFGVVDRPAECDLETGQFGSSS